MSETKHTPGPWTTEEGISSEGHDGWFVVSGRDGRALWADDVGDGGVCSLADARLIAAAPELLRLVKRSAIDLGECRCVQGEDACLVCDAKAVLAKAEGR